MDREGVPETRLAHPVIEEGEVRWVKDAVADAGNGGAQQQHRITGGHAEQGAGQRERGDAEQQHPLGPQPVDGKAGERLPDAADDEEGGGQQPHVRVAERKILHQPRKEWRQHQVEEVRGAVREADQADHLAVALRVGAWGVHYPDSLQAGPGWANAHPVHAS